MSPRDARAQVTSRRERLAAEAHVPEGEVEEGREREEEHETPQEAAVRRGGALAAEPGPPRHRENDRDEERPQPDDLEEDLRERGAHAPDRVGGGGGRRLRVEPRRVRRVVRRQRERRHRGEQEQEESRDLVEPAFLAEPGEGDVHRGVESTTRPRRE
jgi:hypothetical protein